MKKIFSGRYTDLGPTEAVISIEGVIPDKDKTNYMVDAGQNFFL